ncbi:glutathione S-transferase family protein [Microcoleus sp. FACHB-1515]|uniref:glutathione S-transferase family protein n=1 Tax=Cyanophyceae TaxID=3028117 RepID=UPI001682D56D|nr:glutathione S-transferase family protein [Microcoleus sp. FACHB-1515]MBD2092167.1 glutathione S-transferase family protein [Microcoleus sp. FACHB-1515]
MTLTVYGTPISVYVRIVRLLLEEAGADYQLQSVDIFGENRSPDYLRKNPFGKVPTIEIDGEFLYETAAIVGYLDAVFASSKFSPAEPLQLARMRQMMGIVDSHLYAPAIQSIVIQRLIVPSQGGQTDENKVKDAIAPAKTAAEAIESLGKFNPYLLGSNLTIADFYVIPVFIYLAKTPEFAEITSETPKLRSWWDSVSQHPTVQKVCG